MISTNNTIPIEDMTNTIVTIMKFIKGVKASEDINIRKLSIIGDTNITTLETTP